MPRTAIKSVKRRGWHDGPTSSGRLRAPLLRQGLSVRPVFHQLRSPHVVVLDGEKTVDELIALTGATREHIERTVRRNGDLIRARRADGTVVMRVVQNPS